MVETPRRLALDTPSTSEQIDELRADILRTFLAMSALGYAIWHFAFTLLSPTGQEVTLAYLILPAPVATLLGTHVALKRRERHAAPIFLAGWTISLIWASYLLGSSAPVRLFPAVALVAAFVITPAAGGIVTALALGLMIGLNGLRPGIVGPAEVGLTAGLAVLVVVGVGTLRRHLLIALNWYADSFARAEQKTREAREHRAELAQALKQLDTTYYHLERANAALQAAWKAASNAEHARMELAVNLSHELRTPLNLISGYTEMMLTSPRNYRDVPLPPPYRGDLSAVYRSAQHLLALTDDILDLARMESGHLGLLREPVELGQVVRDAVALVQEFAVAKGLELRQEIPGDLPSIVADRLRIRQVLLNLLGNAVRLTEQGTVTARVERQPECLRVSVVDTGPGIAPAEAGATFARFATRDRPRPNWQTGTGLGLPISKQLVELHGGAVGVESALGVGTTFWFTLPLVPTVGATTIGDGKELPRAALREGQPLLVLARPEFDLARLLRRHLASYRIELAHDLPAAVTLAREARAAAIVTDLEDGAEPAGNLVPVIRCPLPGTDRRARRLGVANYLVKPVSRQVLLRAIRDLDQPVHRVLIADDDERFVRLLGRMLSSRDAAPVVRVAHNGEEALASLRADPPDLLLLDLTMPEMDGASVLDQMAREPRLRDVRVIVISAHAEGEGSTPLGTELRVTKPEGLQLAELTRLIDAVLREMTPVRGHVVEAEVPAGDRGSPRG